MKLIAKWYVKISGRNYTPGEMIDISAMNGNSQRLLDMGAVKAVPSYSAAETTSETQEPDADKKTDNKGGGEASDTDEDADQKPDDKGSSEPSDTDEDESPDADTDGDAEEDDDAEAPEIDVADGIVADEVPQPKPKAARGRKKA